MKIVHPVLTLGGHSPCQLTIIWSWRNTILGSRSLRLIVCVYNKALKPKLVVLLEYGAHVRCLLISYSLLGIGYG